MASPEQAGAHLDQLTVLTTQFIDSRVRKDERLSWLSWLTYSGFYPQVVIRQLQVERGTGKVRGATQPTYPLYSGTIGFPLSYQCLNCLYSQNYSD